MLQIFFRTVKKYATMGHQSVYCSLRRYLLTNFVTVVLNLVLEH